VQKRTFSLPARENSESNPSALLDNASISAFRNGDMMKRNSYKALRSLPLELLGMDLFGFLQEHDLDVAIVRGQVVPCY
jgi:hypothetical protein